jgi:hypothetical protein
MPDFDSLKAKVRELAERDWDSKGIEERLTKLMQDGIPRKALNRDEIVANKQQILDRAQLRGEEYEFLSHS